MNRIISKILDEYYSRKLIKEIQECILFNYDLDVRTILGKDVVNIQIKKRKYKDDQYYEIFGFKRDDALSYLIRFNSIRDIIKDSIECYFENEK